MARLTVKRRAELYSKLWKKGGPNYCFFCDLLVLRSQRSLDHLTPHSRGGGTEDSNIVISCRPCNNAKADMTVVEFNQFVMANGGIRLVRRLYGSGPHARAKDLICD